MTILAPGTPLAGLLILAAPPNPANHDPAILVADPVTIKLLDTDVFPKALLQETTLPVKFRRGADATVQLLHDSVASAGVGPNGISFRSLLVATHPSSSSAAAPRFLIYGLLHNSTSLTLHAASLISLDALVHRAPALPYHLPPTPIIPTSSGLASDAIAYLSSLAPRAPSRAVHSNPRLQAILGNPTAVQEPVRRRGGAADGRARRAHTVVSDGPASDASSSTTATVESSGVGRSGKSATRGNLDRLKLAIKRGLQRHGIDSKHAQYLQLFGVVYSGCKLLLSDQINEGKLDPDMLAGVANGELERNQVLIDRVLGTTTAANTSA
ncbi:hypothetical protein, variant [Allomyces macrogynus ATCC 38327]|uniref:Sld7 C-terminal domain-containing protein n=1 Tax=Allomyces macrogynus (strain ATCC 38327) TaxID=578462 RepID=A0A0L0SIG8_ALLM3|nr:hypothetical protein, variant [Allomyces macrogynus ATCC 38327]|eukprot:KNE62244.1 hypothetical protein, variant [Allomyces macrogynus ATCC 38327]